MDAIRDAGWKNYSNAALKITQGIFAQPMVLDRDEDLSLILPGSFLTGNHTSAADVRETLMSDYDSLTQLATSIDPILDRALIQIGDIDSFAEVRNVSAASVQSYSDPLRLSEDQVEKMIAAVLGEPYFQEDWGGELDDMFSAQVRLAGRSVTASFMLKGPGLRAKKMKPKDLGKNGDQITRMTTQPAELYIVQFVGGIDAAVYRQLTDAVVAKRARGEPHVVGSVWNGVDTARLGVAYGLLDPATGQLRHDPLGSDGTS